MPRSLIILSLVLGLAPSARAQAPDSALAAQVRAAERAFAKTMADRDSLAFATHLAAETVFFGRQGAQRGRAAVAAAWRAYFVGPQAPFSWDPETVEVLASGTLALTSGPVRDPSGNRIGTFNSIWRREADGRWRVVFDKGCPAGS